ncbi:MAG: hypothetical protein P4L53_09280 [Candidatus Obscuribacterales bacterium]|nr:hypothetical protein [Candidatus Obscuribacterales bacterium]
MTDIAANETTYATADEAFENRGAPISTGAANHALSQLIKLVPTGGSIFGLSTSYIQTSVGTTISEDDSWRIDVTLEVPSRASLLFAWLASLGVKATTRKIQFVLRADQLSGTASSDGSEATHAQLYTVLNGDFPNQLFGQGEPTPQDFRDKELRNLYGAVYATTDFEDVLKVIRSELTGGRAFEDTSE